MSGSTQPQTGSLDRPVLDPDPPEPVRTAFLEQDWNHIAFVHWPYPAEVVARSVPAPFAPQTFDGMAWVGFTPFLVDRAVVAGIPLPGRLPAPSDEPLVDSSDGVRAKSAFALPIRPRA